jgi:hypothetical protein
MWYRPLVVDRWPLFRGNRWHRFDCIYKIDNFTKQRHRRQLFVRHLGGNDLHLRFEASLERFRSPDLGRRVGQHPVRVQQLLLYDREGFE